MTGSERAITGAGRIAKRGRTEESIDVIWTLKYWTLRTALEVGAVAARLYYRL